MNSEAQRLSQAYVKTNKNIVMKDNMISFTMKRKTALRIS